MATPFDIQAFGAVPGGAALNTAAIQKTLDTCHAAGGGRVTCGPGRFRTGTLRLPGGVELHLAAGCRLEGSPDRSEYAPLTAPGFHGEYAPEGCATSLIQAADAEDIAITGPGELDGAGEAFYDPPPAGSRKFDKPPGHRPRLIMLYNCRRVRLADLSLTNAPNWTVWLMQCEDVAVRGLAIRGDRRMRNVDGIDIDACRRVTVSDCLIHTEDDCLILRAIQKLYDREAVCEQVTVSNCVLDSTCQGVRIGCPSDHIIRQCTFSNLSIRSAANGINFDYPRRYQSKLPAAGVDVHDILFSNIVLDCGRHPIRLCVEDGVRIRRVADVSFSDIRARSAAPCLVQGNPETPIRRVAFRHLALDTEGDEAVVCRHCEQVSFTDVTVSNKDPVAP